jgi:hypothetical protein
MAATSAFSSHDLTPTIGRFLDRHLLLPLPVMSPLRTAALAALGLWEDLSHSALLRSIVIVLLT